MQHLRVFLTNSIVSVPLLVGALPVMAPSVALCPSYPLTAWLAPDRWIKPSFRWGVAPLVAGVVGYLLYRWLLWIRASRPGLHLLEYPLWGIAFGLLYAWVMGSVDEVVAAWRGPAASLGEIPLIASVLVFGPLLLVGYPQAVQCGGLAALVLIVGGTCVGIANGVLVRLSRHPAGTDTRPLEPRRRRPSVPSRWMLRIAAISGAVLFGLWARDYLRVGFYLIPVVMVAPHDMGSMPSVSPDGSKIVHVREPGDIYVMGADGSNPVRLTETPAFELPTLRSPGDVEARLQVTLPTKRRPSYSPDGGQIVYVSDVSPREADGGRLYIMDAGGGRSRRLGAGDPELRGVDYPVFSPDGTRIACTIQGGRHIYVMDADGSNGTIVASLAGVQNLSFSPDGSMLLFDTYFGSEGMPAGIHLMSLDGTSKTYLGFSGTDPAYSPDGRRIVFYTVTNDGRAAIEIMDPDGSNRRPILSTEFPASDAHPRFSRDGSRIVFVSGPRHDRGLYVVDADGGNVRRLSPHYRGWFGTLAPAIVACTGLLLVILAGVRLARARAISSTQREV